MTLEDFLNKLYEESKTRNKENLSVSDYESISYEIGVQFTIDEIRKWAEENPWLHVNDSVLVRYKDDL